MFFSHPNVRRTSDGTSRWPRYAYAAALVPLAMASEHVLLPAQEGIEPYLTSQLAIALAAGLGGLGPGLLTLALCLVVSAVMPWTSPQGAAPLSSAAAFATSGAVIVLLFEVVRERRSRERRHVVELAALTDAATAIAAAGDAETLAATLATHARRLADASHAVARVAFGPDRRAVRAEDGDPTGAAHPRPGPTLVVPLDAADGRSVGVLEVAASAGADGRALLDELAQHAVLGLARLEAEARACASEARARAVALATSGVVWRSDAAGSVTEAVGWTAFTGLAEGAAHGLGWLAAIHPEDIDRVLQVLDRARRERAVGLVDCRLRTAAGRHRWVALRAVPIADADGALREWIGTVSDIDEERRARIALQRNEERIAGILRQATVGIAQCDASGRFVLANDCFCAMVGRSREDLLALRIHDVTHPADLARDLELFDGTLRAGEEHAIETRYVRADGSVRWVAGSLYGVRSPGTEDRTVCIMCFDVTARTQAEAELAASERRFRRVVDSNVIGMVFWEERGGIVDANQAFLDMVGYTAADVQARHLAWPGLLRPDDQLLHLRALEEIRANGICAPIESELVRRDGARLPILCAGASLATSPLRVVTWVVDISAVKRAEAERETLLHEAERARAEAFRAAERLRRVQSIADAMLGDLPLDDLLRRILERVRTMFDATTAVILLRDRDVLRVRAAVGLETADCSEVRVPIGEGFDGAIARDGRPLVWDRVDYARVVSPYIRDKGIRSLVGVPLLTDDGLLGVLNVGSARPLRFTADDVELLRLAAERIAVGIERAERRDAERRARDDAEAASRAKDEFLAMLGHELRNPLAAVRNAIAVARLDKSRSGRALDIARRQAQQLGRLVDDLLDVARITRGAITLRRERVRVADVIARAVDAVRELVEERSQELTVRLPTEPLDVDGDPIRLAQVVTNLLNNAAKYTSPRGHIAVSAERQGDRAIVRVRDDGTGIPRELLGHVFELFAQGSRTLDRSLGGLGVGLTVVRRVVELHGGTVAVHSDGPGRGAEFVVELPVLSTRGADEPTTLPVPVRPTAESQRVLVVEDNAEAADAFVMLLEQLGHVVEVAYDGPGALEAIERHAPDVAIVDIGLPGMDGYEVARRIVAQQTARRPVLVALTGYGRQEDRLRALDAGFDHHLVKPVELEVLQDLLESIAVRRAS